jgi:hypothetical protein
MKHETPEIIFERVEEGSFSHSNNKPSQSHSS